MGKPTRFGGDLITLGKELTQGSKTFQYLEEKRTIVISLVAASEKEGAQTWLHSHDVSSASKIFCGSVAGGCKAETVSSDTQSYKMFR
jgi:hypothetical protein